MRHYENTEGDSRKFWEINLQGSNVTVRYGRLGTSGQRKSWQFGSQDEAKRDWEKRIAQKTRRGYRLMFVDGVDTTATSGNGQPKVELARNPELEAVILEDPDDDEGILVYGDWLAERGDPRGQLILTYRRMHEETDPAKFVGLKKHAEAIITEHSSAFFGRVADYTDRIRIRWRLGFFDNVRIMAMRDEPATHETLDALLDAPATLLLRTLDIELLDAKTNARLMSAELPALRSLEFALPSHQDVQLSSLLPLLDGKVAPRIRRLSISRDGDCEKLVAAISRGTIAHQLVHVGFSGADMSQQTAELLLTRFPKLRTFDLSYCGLDDDFLERLQARLAQRS